MVEFLILAAVGAGMGISYIKIRDFVRERLRFVDAAQKRSTPWLAGIGAMLALAPVVALLPVVGAGTALVFGAVVGFAVRKGQREVHLLSGR